jgi:hypothetical protein
VEAMNMRISMLPKTSLGKWSTGLIIAALLMVVVSIIEVVLGSRGGVTFHVTGAWQITNLLVVVFAISSMVIGIIGIVKSKERSILVFVATALGVLVVVLVLIIAIGELLVSQ